MPNILHKLQWKFRIMVVDIMILIYHKRNQKEARNNVDFQRTGKTHENHFQ